MKWNILREVAHETDDENGRLPSSTWEPTGEVFDDDEGASPVVDELSRLQAEHHVCFGASAAT